MVVNYIIDCISESCRWQKHDVELTVDSGTAKLYWLDKGEEKMIADTSKNGTYSVTLDEGDNYLTLEGNDFCGSLQVVVE